MMVAFDSAIAAITVVVFFSFVWSVTLVTFHDWALLVQAFYSDSMLSSPMLLPTFNSLSRGLLDSTLIGGQLHSIVVVLYLSLATQHYFTVV